MTKNKLHLDKQLLGRPSVDSYEYVYSGYFDDGIIKQIMKVTESKYVKRYISKSLRKRIAFVIIENIENIIKHQYAPDNFNYAENCIFILNITPQNARIFTGNYVRKENQEALKARIDEVISMSPSELKEKYKQVISSSESGEGGLGFISMGRITDGHLKYGFEPVDDETVFFYFQNQLSISDESSIEDETAFFERMIDYHKLLGTNKVLVSYRGIFSFDNLETLLPIIHSQHIGGFGFKRMIYNVSVNLIRNIVLYAESSCLDTDDFLDEYRKENDALGFYVMNRKGDNIIISSGNYIANDKVLTLKNKIDLINETGREGLVKIRDYLNNFYLSEQSNRPDVSLIDMKLISKKHINYYASAVDTKRSFFIIQIEV